MNLLHFLRETVWSFLIFCRMFFDISARKIVLKVLNWGLEIFLFNFLWFRNGGKDFFERCKNANAWNISSVLYVPANSYLNESLDHQRKSFRFLKWHNEAQPAFIIIHSSFKSILTALCGQTVKIFPFEEKDTWSASTKIIIDE